MFEKCSSTDSCPGRPVTSGRYFLSEELIWRILSGIVRYRGVGVSRLSRSDVRRYVRDHTCHICGRVFLSRLDLVSHHAIRIFDGYEVIDPAENILDLDSLFPHFQKHSRENMKSRRGGKPHSRTSHTL